MSLEADELARRCAEVLWQEDRATRGLGMELIEVGPGRATLAMSITEAMTNGHGICHGGFIFALADSAFAFSCNTYDQRVVAQHCAVTYIRSAKVGDRLVARAVERSRTGRSGIYDISVARADGTMIAEFRGHSRTIEGKILPPAGAERE